MKKAIFLIAAVILLTGCADGRKSISKRADGIYPDITEYKGHNAFSYYYIVDNKTGVVYLGSFNEDGAGCGLSVMLNRDGTPITKEQIEVRD